MERKRLEGKRGILESGLQGLKNLLKRRTVVNVSKEDLGRTMGQIFAETPSKSEASSADTNSVGSVVSEQAYRHIDSAAALRPSDE